MQFHRHQLNELQRLTKLSASKYIFIRNATYSLSGWIDCDCMPSRRKDWNKNFIYSPIYRKFYLLRLDNCAQVFHSIGLNAHIVYRCVTSTVEFFFYFSLCSEVISLNDPNVSVVQKFLPKIPFPANQCALNISFEIFYFFKCFKPKNILETALRQYIRENTKIEAIETKIIDFFSTFNYNNYLEIRDFDNTRNIK